MMIKVNQYYGVLDLEPGDSAEKVKQAYRDLAFVWHPDRYSQYPRLREKAQEKLKILNEAHDQLEELLRHQSYQAPQPHLQPPPPCHPKSDIRIELL
jgi:curved DNA-binding protein CbpA